MTLKSGKGWITLQRGRVTTTGETALESKARAHVQKQQQKQQGSKQK